MVNSNKLNYSAISIGTLISLFEIHKRVIYNQESVLLNGAKLMNNYKTRLETDRLILRPPKIDDFGAFHSWCSNPENTRYMSFGPNNEEQTKAWLAQSKPGLDFAVVIKDTNAVKSLLHYDETPDLMPRTAREHGSLVIGSCGIYPDEKNYMGTLGWILHKDYWKHGYGTELGGELIRYGFEDLKLGRIQAPCAAANYGSYRVMERNGMRREALHRKAFWTRLDKEWVDEAWYAILAEDYFQKTLNPTVDCCFTEGNNYSHNTIPNISD